MGTVQVSGPSRVLKNPHFAKNDVPSRYEIGAGFRRFTLFHHPAKVVGRFPNETSALVMVFSLLEEDRVKWQKVGMRAEDITWIEEASKTLEQEPIKLEFLEKALVA